MIGSERWLGVPSDRVVAIEATLDTGKFQVGSGYLLNNGIVITARHCTADKRTGRPAVSIKVVRRSDGAYGTAQVLAAALDVAVLAVPESASWTSVGQLDLPRFGRVDASYSGELLGCEAVGFPLWQLDPHQRHRHAAELHGSIRATEGAESGLLVMRDPTLWDVGIPDGVAPDDRLPDSPWGGLSGALVFHSGTGLGVVIEHHPWQGHSALTIMPIQRVATAAARGDPDAIKVASTLGLPPATELPVVPARRAGPTAEHLAIGMAIENPAHDPRVGDRLSWVIVNALRAAGISPDRCERQDEGEGRQILTLPSGLNMPGTVVAMLRAMRLVASQADGASNQGERTPVLTTLAKGRISLTSNGYEGPGISAASNMLESGILRAEIRGEKRAEFAAMFSNDLYLQLYSQGYGLFDFNQFRPVNAVVRGTPAASQCWLYTPVATADASLTIAFSDVPGANARSRLLGAIPLAGLGALMVWEHTQHSAAHHEPGISSEKDHHDPHERHDRGGHGGHHADDPSQPDHHDYTHVETGHSNDYGHDDATDYNDHGNY